MRDKQAKELKDLHVSVAFNMKQVAKFRGQLEQCEAQRDEFKRLYEQEVYDRNHAYERFPYLKKVVAEYERLGGKLSSDEQAAKRVFEKRY
jgi:hypothetical protein